MKGSLESAMSGIKTEAKNGLVINKVNISNSMQIILTKFAVTVARRPLTYFIFKISIFEEFLISAGSMVQTFDTKYLNPLSANFTKCSNKMVKFGSKLQKNCLSVFDHFVGLALKGLRCLNQIFRYWQYF